MLLKHFSLTLLISALVTPAMADDLALLGKQIFNDSSLSTPAGQACASCHRPSGGFADPGQVISEGAVKGRFGNRNAPTIAYLGDVPARHYDSEDGTWIGGFFLDGRASTLEEQARGPLFNPLEMNNRDPRELARKVALAPWAEALEKRFGEDMWQDPERVLDAVTTALAAYERSPELNAFSSKYDAWLRGEAQLSALEKRGLELFEDEKKGNCAACHPSKPVDGRPPLFTDFSYDNLGVPRLKDHPYYRQASNPLGDQWRDPGLAGSSFASAEEQGKFKVPTLRNIALTAPYMHNGVFETLEEVVAFYNRRDTETRWQPAETEANINRDELGDLRLSKEEEQAIVAFLKTLSDGYRTSD